MATLDIGHSAMNVSAPVINGRTRHEPFHQWRADYENLSLRERKLLVGFLVFILWVVFPGKVLFQFSAGVLLIVSLWGLPLISLSRLLLLVLAVSAMAIAALLRDILVDGLIVHWVSSALALQTFSMTMLVLTPSPVGRIGDRFIPLLVRLLAVFLILQSGIATLQWLAAEDTREFLRADAVSGTFGLFDAWTGNISISQVNFTFTMFCVIVLCLSFVHERLVCTGVITGLIACILAQSGHQSIFFIVAILMSVILIMGVSRSLWIMAGVVTVLMAGLTIAYPNTVRDAGWWFEKVVLSDQSVKWLAIQSGFARLGEPGVWVLGLGAGQYASRATLFLGGYQGTVPSHDLFGGASEYFKIDMEPLIARFLINGEGSAMAKPYFTALSIPMEFGVPATVLLLSIVSMELFRIRRWARAAPESQRILGVFCSFVLIFTMLCCFIENYLELIQAVSVPFGLYLIARTTLRTSARQNGARGTRRSVEPMARTRPPAAARLARRCQCP
jgi:hypothetical protein